MEMNEKKIKPLATLSAFTLMLVGAGISTGAQAQAIAAASKIADMASSPIAMSELAGLTTTGKAQLVTGGNHDHNWLGGDHDHPTVIRVAGAQPGYFDV
jgi:hypothetical protein